MKKTLLYLILLMTYNVVSATNYYVDAINGKDINSGTTPGRAWQTIEKVNGANLIAGDSVLFCRGQIFRGFLVPISGSAVGNITYGAYGTGNKPKLLGSIQKKSTTDWVSEGGNIWHKSLPVVNVVGVELLPNPDFSTNLSGWYLWNNTTNGASSVLSRTVVAGQYYTAPGGGKLVCTNHGAGASDIQLWTNNCSITSGKWYKFTFKAKASQQFTIPYCYIKLFKNVSPYTNYSSSPSKPAVITTSWVTYEIYFKAGITATDARVCFYLGNIIPNGTTFYFDALSFKVVDSDPGLISVDVGNIIFNDEASCGIKVKYAADLNAQGKFWYNMNNFNLKLYSVSNPASFYSNIEIALDQHMIEETDKSYITYENLDLRYGGAYGIKGGNTHHIWVKDMDFSWLGGGYQADYGDGFVRYGNGVEFWDAAHDNIVERCTFNQIWDAALSVQGNGNPYEEYNIYFRNNLVRNSEYSYELWGDPAGTNLHDIYFENNTCLYAGYGWSHTQRPDPNGAHLMFWGYKDEQTNNIFIRNNIFYESSNYGARYDNNTTLTKVIVDYNCWYESSGQLALIAGINYDYATQWTTYQQASGQDAHSIHADPLLNTNYTLSNNSPCIDAGITTLAVNDDYNRNLRPQGKQYEIGAFEFKGITITIVGTSVPPIIDGVGSDAIWFALPAYPVTKSLNDVSGISGYFKMCYDINNVYVLLNVNDNSPATDATDGYTYDSDCDALYFNMDTNNAAAYRPGDWQIRKLISKTQADGGVDGVNSVNFSALTSDPDFKVLQTMGTNSYTQEWQIPIATLKQTANYSGKNFRFDIQLTNDYLGNRTGDLYWNSNADDQWHKIQNQGYVNLSPFSILIESSVPANTAKAAETNTATDIKKTAISDFIIFPNPSAGVVNLKNTHGTVNVKVFDLNGKNVFTAYVNDGRLNLSNLKDGIYFMNVANENSSKYLKLVIKK